MTHLVIDRSGSKTKGFFSRLKQGPIIIELDFNFSKKSFSNVFNSCILIFQTTEGMLICCIVETIYPKMELTKQKLIESSFKYTAYKQNPI